MDRREFLSLLAAASALPAFGAATVGGAGFARAASGSMTQDDLLSFDAEGQVTLMHITDIHAQLKPIYFREPSINVGFGAADGLPPHITGEDFLKHFDIQPGSPLAYALSSVDFADLAAQFGKVGGMDRVATLVKAIRGERGAENCILLDGGDTWHGSYSAMQTGGMDMVKAMNLLGVDAMTGHWEFTLGEDRVLELVDALNFPFLANNMRDTEWDEPVFDGITYMDRGGVNTAVIGQAFPYTPIANPRWMIPNWSFGIQEKLVQDSVNEARDNGAELVVMLSHNGFDVDRKLASRVEGIDLILTGHTHDALPRPEQVGNTFLIASGSNAKYLSRLDVTVEAGRMKSFNHKLIPVFSDVITPDAEMAALVDGERAPFEAHQQEVIGRTSSTLYRRGNLNGTFDDLICEALLEQRDAEIALSPGFRWGPTLIPGQEIRREDVYNATSMSYPAVYRTEMTGETIRTILEDVADNLFNPDPYFQQGGDMVRLGGLSADIYTGNAMGSRMQNLTTADGKPLDDSRTYVVAGWASVNEGTEGPAIWDLLTDHIQDKGEVTIEPNDRVRYADV